MRLKAKIENGDYWQEDNKDLVFNEVNQLESAVDDFINEAQEAYTLNLLDTSYTYDDIIVDSYDDHDKLITSKCYLDYMAENVKDFNISIGLSS